MNNSVIEIKKISKKYNITHMKGGYLSLRDTIANAFRNPFRFATHKVKQVTGRMKKEVFWALKDVSFSVNAGEVIGIIGANGAGKSTLLKILTGITPPSEGEVILHGRVGSLLEVGTGFHPELSGRENIFLNGAILGMKKKEIIKKFDEIVAFAGIEKFLDTPVKHYSSGMYVRLAFSVAAHMEPEILLIDEVLAVGDAEFQKKCMGKMEDITSKDGRTIIFVSHNLQAIEKLCHTVVLLEHGEVKMIGPAKEIIDHYLQKNTSTGTLHLGETKNRQGTGGAKVLRVSLQNSEGKEGGHFISGEKISFVTKYELSDPTIQEFTFAFPIINKETHSFIGQIISKIDARNLAVQPNSTRHGIITITFDKLPLNVGSYLFNVFLQSKNTVLDWIIDAGSFDVGFGDFYGTGELPEDGDALFNYQITSR